VLGIPMNEILTKLKNIKKMEVTTEQLKNLY
jgi:hypothetical protein